jgi:dihydroxy-acid dehydratase
MKQLQPLLHLDARSVSGQTVGENLRDFSVNDEEVIRPLDRPFSTRPTLIIVRGSLLPGGGIVRLGGVRERKLQFRGPANVYHSREEALEAIRKGEVKRGQVMVLRGLGVMGGPGMAMTSAVVFALDGAGLVEDVAVITEGQLSGLVNMGLVVGEASPEAAAGGPIALVENGDAISIDVARREVNLEVPAEVLEARRSRVGGFGARNERGWLSVYQRTVQPVHKGAVLIPEKS